jgi:hypothetical protein
MVALMRGLVVGGLLLISACGRPRSDAVAAAAPPDVVPNSDGQPGIECASFLTWHPELGCTVEGGNDLHIVHRDRMGGAFVLLSSTYAIDGRAIARFDAPPNDAPGDKDIPIAQSRAGRGPHQLQIGARYRGHGAGVFSYLQGYTFDVRSTCTFALSGTPQHIFVVAESGGGPTTPLEERPRIHCELK